jgi:hypothetical protein
MESTEEMTEVERVCDRAGAAFDTVGDVASDIVGIAGGAVARCAITLCLGLFVTEVGRQAFLYVKCSSKRPRPSTQENF